MRSLKRIKRIHINQHKIKANIKNDRKDPVITVKTSNSNDYAHRVRIEGPSTVVYPDKPLPCGARVWIETFGEVELITELPNIETIERKIIK